MAENGRQVDDGLELELVQHVADLWRCLRQFSRATEDSARRHGLTPQQYRMMIMIEGAPDGGKMATVGQLQEQLRLAQSSVTGLVDRADAAGLVTREDAIEDGRRTEVRLTREGERRLKAAVAELTMERRTFARLVTELRNLL
ncbi:MAG TPA: MarR family transcriptional regulator [Gaiellales bacterium]|nr:MarR family transcriptional regulator [Gaiellales bacterium]